MAARDRLAPDPTYLRRGQYRDGSRPAAPAKFRGSRSGRAVALTADAQALPFDPDEFDVVVANHMLYHVPDPALAVAELARVLRPGGTLLAATNGHRHLRELGEIRRAVFGGTDSLLDAARAFGIESGEPLLRECFGAVEWRGLDGEPLGAGAH